MITIETSRIHAAHALFPRLVTVCACCCGAGSDPDRHPGDGDSNLKRFASIFWRDDIVVRVVCIEATHKTLVDQCIARSAALLASILR